MMRNTQIIKRANCVLVLFRFAFLLLFFYRILLGKKSQTPLPNLIGCWHRTAGVEINIKLPVECTINLKAALRSSSYLIDCLETNWKFRTKQQKNQHKLPHRWKKLTAESSWQKVEKLFSVSNASQSLYDFLLRLFFSVLFLFASLTSFPWKLQHAAFSEHLTTRYNVDTAVGESSRPAHRNGTNYPYHTTLFAGFKRVFLWFFWWTF